MSPFASLRRLKRGPATPGLMAALGTGVALHIAGIALVGATWRMPAPPTAPELFVRAVPVDSALNEAADLLDPSPLFLPTSRNYGAESARPKAAGFDKPPLPAPTRSRPDLRESPLHRAPAYAPLTDAYAKRPPQEQLPQNAGDLFYTAGRKAPENVALAPTGPRCVIRNADTGVEVKRATLPAGMMPAEADRLLECAEFFVEVDAYGASPPQLRHGTGDAECDRKLASALDSLLSKEPLKAGRYTIEAAP